MSAGRGLHRQMLSFGLIGVGNTLIDAGVFALLLAVSMPVLLANLLAWVCGVSFSFAMNARWTFAAPAPGRRLAAFVRFAASGALVSLACSTAILAVLAGPIGVWPAKALAIAVGAVLGFLAARWSIEGAGLRR